MKCTFYRPETINTEEWNNIRSKLRADLEELETGKVPGVHRVLHAGAVVPARRRVERLGGRSMGRRLHGARL